MLQIIIVMLDQVIVHGDYWSDAGGILNLLTILTMYNNISAWSLGT